MVEGRFRSQAYGMQFATFGVLVLVVAFLLPFVLARTGLALFPAAAVGVVLLLVAAWMFRLMASGGVAVGEDGVDISGWFRHETVPTREVRAVSVRRDGNGQPAAWLDLGDREVFLRGLTYRHRHDPFASGGTGNADGAPACQVCREQLTGIRRLADRLGVEVVEAGARRGSIPGFW